MCTHFSRSYKSNFKSPWNLKQVWVLIKCQLSRLTSNPSHHQGSHIIAKLDKVGLTLAFHDIMFVRGNLFSVGWSKCYISLKTPWWMIDRDGQEGHILIEAPPIWYPLFMVHNSFQKEQIDGFDKHAKVSPIMAHFGVIINMLHHLKWWWMGDLFLIW